MHVFFLLRNECFCGTDEPPLSSKIPDSSCNLKCPGDQHSTCGGYYTINIYQTGIKSESSFNVLFCLLVFFNFL